MFVVFNMIQPEKGLLKRRRQKKEISRNGIHIIRSDKCLPFFILDVLDGKNGVDWKTVAAECGRYATRVIAPKNLILPDESGLKRFAPASMNSLLIFNTAKETIKKAAIPPDKFSITLTDRSAAFTSRISELLPLSSQIRVVTAYPQRYAAVCAEAFNEFGASVMIRSAYEETSLPDAVICTDGNVTAAMKNAAVFTVKGKAGGKLVFWGNGTELLPVHSEILPDIINPVDFAGALTELCGCGDYKNAVFSETDSSCKSCNCSPAEKCFECFVKSRNA